MSYTNTLIKGIASSATMAVAARAKELQRQGRSICDLGAGELDIDTPDHIKAAAYEAMRSGKTKYTAVNGILELREALARKFREENAITTAKADQVIVTNGGKQAIHEALQVCIDPGEEVIIFAPYWVSYPPMIEIAGGKPVVISSGVSSGYKVTPDQLKQALSDKTKMIIINSPSNPTGVAYTRDELAALGQVLKGSRALVLSDEVYEKIIFDGFTFCSFVQAVPELADRTITINSFSKSHSMTGWRVGYATGPAEVISAMNKLQGQTTTNVNSIAQYAALAALNGSNEFMKGVMANLTRRRDFTSQSVRETPGLALAFEPVGAFYMFISIAGILQGPCKRQFKGSMDFSTALLEEAGVAVVPGLAFGDDQAVRISLSSADENLKEALKRMHAFTASVF